MIKKIVHEFEVKMQLLMNTYSRSVAENFIQLKATFEERKWKKIKMIISLLLKNRFMINLKKKKVIRLNRHILSENNQWIFRDKTHQ